MNGMRMKFLCTDSILLLARNDLGVMGDLSMLQCSEGRVNFSLVYKVGGRPGTRHSTKTAFN